MPGVVYPAEEVQKLEPYGCVRFERQREEEVSQFLDRKVGRDIEDSLLRNDFLDPAIAKVPGETHGPRPKS